MKDRAVWGCAWEERGGGQGEGTEGVLPSVGPSRLVCQRGLPSRVSIIYYKDCLALAVHVAIRHDGTTAPICPRGPYFGEVCSPFSFLCVLKVRALPGLQLEDGFHPSLCPLLGSLITLICS